MDELEMRVDAMADLIIQEAIKDPEKMKVLMNALEKKGLLEKLWEALMNE